MGVMGQFKKIFSKQNSERTGTPEQKTEILGIETRYGKRLDLSAAEKTEMVQSLTPREKEAFFILLGGYSLKETAKQLEIGYSTANTYQTAIYRKLHVNSRAELIINYRDICETQKEDNF